MWKFFISSFLMGILLILNLAYSQNEISCYLSSTCGIAQYCLFSVFKENDSHVGDCNYYDLKLCCVGFSNAYITNNLCQNEEGTILTFNYNNSHIGEGSYTGIGNYGNYSVCVKFLSDVPQVGVKSSCASGEACIISKFQANNSHVGSCNYYDNKICVVQPPIHTGTDVSVSGISFIVRNITDDVLNFSISPEELFAVLEPNKEYIYMIILKNSNDRDVDLSASIECPVVESFNNTYVDPFCSFINFEAGNSTLKNKINFTIVNKSEYKLNVSIIVPQGYLPSRENIIISFKSSQGLMKSLNVRFVESEDLRNWYEKLYDATKFYFVDFWNFELVRFPTGAFGLSGIYGSNFVVFVASMILFGGIVWFLKKVF